MPGLTIDNGATSGETIADAAAHLLITTTLTAGVWGTYSVRPGTDAGWTLLGPSNDPGPLAVSGSAATPEDKTWTPVYPGRYLVKFQGYDGADQVNLTAVYEIGAAEGEHGLPAPQETLEMDAVAGWWPAIEGRMRALGRMHAGVSEAAYVTAAAPAAVGAAVQILTGVRWRGAGADTSDAIEEPGSYLYECNPLSGAPSADSTIALLVEPLLAGGKALAVSSGLIPFDTSLWALGAAVYVDAAGALSDVPGATVRRIGTVEAVGGAIMAAGTFGVLRVDGAPLEEAPAVYASASAPTTSNDAADSAGLGRIFVSGALWVDTSTNLLYVLVDDTALAAVWAVQAGEPLPSPLPLDAPDLSAFVDAANYGALAGLTSSPPYLTKCGAVAFDNPGATVTGILTPVAAGDFVWHVRFGVKRVTDDYATAAWHWCQAVYVAAPSTSTLWVGVGSENRTTSVDVGRLVSSKSAVSFAVTSNQATSVVPDITLMDAVITRVGTTLTMYVGRSGGQLQRKGVWPGYSSVSALVGVRIDNRDAARVQQGLVYGSRLVQGSADLPWDAA